MPADLAFAGPLSPAQPNRVKREQEYIDQTDNLQRRNLLRYEAVFSCEAVSAVGHPRAVSEAVYRASNQPCPAPKPAEWQKKSTAPQPIQRRARSRQRVRYFGFIFLALIMFRLFIL